MDQFTALAVKRRAVALEKMQRELAARYARAPQETMCAQQLQRNRDNGLGNG